MKIIKIESLKIKNFKGLKNETFEFGGQSVNVFGTNATGKTTIQDSFTWCLFEKDSLGNTKFAIKPIDPITKQEIHNLETSVEVKLNVDNKNITFKRTYEEVYRKVRGSAELEFTGHTSNFYVNSVPTQKKEYSLAIAEIIDEDKLKLISNPLDFVNRHWKFQRETMFGIAKPITDLEIIEKNPKIKLLAKILEVSGNSVEDNLRIANASNKDINKELKTIPTAIETLSNKVYDVEINDKEEIINLIKAKNIELEKLYAEKQNVDGSGELLKLKNELNELLISLNDAEQLKREELKVKQDGLTNQEDAIIKAIRGHSQAINKLSDDKKFNTAKIETLKTNESILLEQRKQLYKDYDEVNARNFTNDVCAYCKQPLPDDKLEELRKEFNLNKSTELERITAKGKTINDKLKQFKDAYKECQEAINYCDDETALTIGSVKELQNKQDELTSVKLKSEHDKQISYLNNLITAKQEQIKNLTVEVNGVIITEKINKVNQELDSLRRDQTILEEKTKNDLEIKDLEFELSKNTRLYESNLKIIDLCETFTKIKAELLEESINANFKIVNFKLFNELVNGGVEETCTATVDGVPFATVNNANRINAGLDIINALQTIYGVSAPIFIDNAEAVVEFLETDTQLIKLYVSEEDKVLRIEKI